MSEVEGISIKAGQTTIEIKDNEEIVFNGGLNKGIIINDRLKIEIAKLNTAITTLKMATNTALVAIDALLPGTSAAFTLATSLIQQANLNNVTNEKIKH